MNTLDLPAPPPEGDLHTWGEWAEYLSQSFQGLGYSPEQVRGCALDAAARLLAHGFLSEWGFSSDGEALFEATVPPALRVRYMTYIIPIHDVHQEGGR